MPHGRIYTFGQALAQNLMVRLVILLMLALMFITGVYDYTRLVGVRERLVAQTQDDARIFAETLALAVRQNVRRGRTTDELQELLEDILTRPGIAAVAIYDPDGHTIAAQVGAKSDPPAADAAVQEVLLRRKAAAVLLTAGGEEILRYIQPYRWPGGRSAAIEVRHTLGEVVREFHRAVRESIVSRAIVLFFFIVSVVAVTRWHIGRPIGLLIAGARAVGTGDLAQRIPVRRRDEIGQLAREFNRMAENLQTAHAAVLQEAAERLRLERQVQQAQKLATVGLLAAKVAHEIGTPLNVISGRSEVLQGAVPAAHPARRHVDVVLRQVERINKIIRALLDYARPKQAAPGGVAVRTPIERVVDLLADDARQREVRVLIELPKELPLVLADADQLQQLFLNLLVNALDVSAPGQTIRITAGDGSLLPPGGCSTVTRGKVLGAHLAVHVLDTGQGLAPEQLAHVFEPFFSTKSPGRGTGLGLPITEEIVRAHRGDIEMRSIPGQGTEVIVRLPLAPAEATGPQLPAEVPPGPAPDAV